jgi:hypothetical protein
MSKKVTRQQLIQEYRRLADELGKKPTLGEFEDGKCSSTPVYKRFESFEELKEAAGFETGEYRIPSDELIEDVQGVADTIGRVPPVEEYREHGNYNFKTLKYRWGSWYDVLEACGFEPTDHSQHWEDTEYTPSEKPTVTVECDYCGGPAEKTELQLERFENAYCSPSCQYAVLSEQTGEDARAWDGGKVKIECEWCGEPDKVKPAEVDNSRFCSQGCMIEWRSDFYSGENHPRWTENPKYRYYGPNWEEQSEKCRKRDNQTCQVCGLSNEDSLELWGESLTAHHIIRFYDFESHKIANQLPNLVASCKVCHGYLDSGRKGIPQEHEERFREWVQSTDKTVADATVRL